MFAHRLALELGTWDVDALLEEIPWRVLKRWIAYFRAEPWGAGLHRSLTSILCAAFGNAMGGKKDGKAFQPADFPIEFGSPADDVAGPDGHDPAEIMAALGMLGAKLKKVE